jgi:hypothetical protein
MCQSASWPPYVTIGETHMQTLASSLLIFVLAVPIQRVEIQNPDRGKVMRVETATNHLTVIELAEPVILAAAGSPVFKIERRDNKVFIQPLEEGASTNLFVWTGSGRWNYELVPAVSVETMHFAIDQELIQNSVIPETSSSISFAEEMLLFAKPIRTLALRHPPTKVQAFITDVYRKDDHMFVRYVIDNRTKRSYAGGPPEVSTLESVRSRTSMFAFRYSQVGADIDRTIRSEGQTPITVVDCEMTSEPVRPGEMVTGILTLHFPEPLVQPTVLKFVFPADGQEPISVTVIL